MQIMVLEASAKLSSIGHMPSRTISKANDSPGCFGFLSSQVDPSVVHSRATRSLTLTFYTVFVPSQPMIASHNLLSDPFRLHSLVRGVPPKRFIQIKLLGFHRYSYPIKVYIPTMRRRFSGFKSKRPNQRHSGVAIGPKNDELQI